MAAIKIANLKGQIDCPYCFSLLQWDSATDVHCFNGTEYVICPQCEQHIILNQLQNYWFGTTKTNNQLFLIESIIDNNGNFPGSDVSVFFENPPVGMKITHEKIEGDTTRPVEFKLIPDPHGDMIWYQNYSEENDLWPHDNENEEQYIARINQFFNTLITEDEEEGTALKNKYFEVEKFYHGLYEIPYSGDWGESLGDFFNPANDSTEYENALFYLANTDYFEFIFIHEDTEIMIATEDDVFEYTYDSSSNNYKDKNSEDPSEDPSEDIPGATYIEDILTENGTAIPSSTIDNIVSSAPETIITSRSASSDISEGITPQMEFELVPTPREDMLWFEGYNEENNLWPGDNESQEQYNTRLNQFFASIIAQDEEIGTALKNKYLRTMAVYFGIYEVPYSGDWGESLGDFFNPPGDTPDLEGVLLYIGKNNNEYIVPGVFIFINHNGAMIIQNNYYYYDILTDKYILEDSNTEPSNDPTQ